MGVLRCFRQDTCGLYFTIVLEEKRQCYSIAEVFRQLELWDDDCFDYNTSGKELGQWCTTFFGRGPLLDFSNSSGAKQGRRLSL